MKKTSKRVLLGGAAVLGVPIATFVALVVLPVPAPLSPEHTSIPVVIANVGVVDLDGGAILPEQTVVIEKGRIKALGPRDAITVPGDAVRIDGVGRFLIPGLWDMHVHHGTEMSPQLTMPLFIASGVTNIRDMGGYASLEQKIDWRVQIRSGKLLGPRIMGQTGQTLFRLRSAVEARELVAGIEAGNDFIKVLNQVLPDPYFALLEAANRKGIPVLGHRPRAVGAIDAARAGHRSFEHARLFLFECFPGAPELRERHRAQYAGEATSAGRLVTTDLRRAMIDDHDPEMFDALVATMVENDTWFCPTHITRKMDAFAADVAYRNDPRLKYIHFLERWEWNGDADGMIARDPSPRGRATFMDFYEKGLELTGRAHRAGVKVLAGSDAHDAYCFPGFGLHDELQELVKAGLTPVEALRTATVNPAQYFGLSEDFGSIAEGKVADLVLLDANPLEDVANTTTIHAVVYDGNVYTRDDLDETLEYVENNASRLRIVARAIWSNLRDRD
jgi:imidazolonepropionase-like amidohydrolase